MARRLVKTITDDIDGSDQAETIEFSFKHLEYSIDLGQKNQAKLLKALQPFMEAGRKTSKGRGGATTTEAKRTDLDEARVWLGAQGHTVSDRGRISKALLEQFDAR